MSDRIIMLTLTRIEADHLADLIGQFTDLVNATPTDPDPALDRLTPDAYPEDPEASREFRTLTRGDLLHRRAHDAAVVRRALEGIEHADGSDADFTPVDIAISDEAIDSWLRTLTAVRLVIANRLGVRTEDDRDPSDPRFAVYDWLGYRLEGLVQAAEESR
ncbi:DUF2017 domain-containing protein [Microbacterium sp. Marseille-Q6965]|uniref:DUF2017 domain-containing protein n=1 Tax=Microbacterium sp. Marseille-Q6965 TaxID=2965072 RepID=UPI0021B84602|nr:DUF2017 domain-containing protein [Microbacterium sp. Marseille-Q6965]